MPFPAFHRRKEGKRQNDIMRKKREREGKENARSVLQQPPHPGNDDGFTVIFSLQNSSKLQCSHHENLEILSHFQRGTPHDVRR